MNDSRDEPASQPDIESVERAVEIVAKEKSPTTQLWWLTGLSIVLAIGLGSWSWFTRGIKIHIQFRDGHGLRAENRLMHRGIEVGFIERVQLDKSLGNVDVQVRLNDSAAALACEGSRFWIERPVASVQGVRSLETILSGRYIAVEPGPDSMKRSYDFQGLDQPPQQPASMGELELILEANDRHGLQVNAPVIYRGLEVGRIQSIGLSADSRWVQVRAIIEADYRGLIRENSRFWNRSGFRIDVGLTGVDIDAESLAAIAVGGIEFATPDAPSKHVKTGRRFELASRAEEDWLAWRPRMLYGAIIPKGLDVAISPQRISMNWNERLFGFRQNKSLSGWILVLSDGTLIAPADLLTAPASAMEGTVRWEAAGIEFGAEEIEAVAAPIANSNSNADRSSVHVAALSGRRTTQGNSSLASRSAFWSDRQRGRIDAALGRERCP